MGVWRFLNAYADHLYLEERLTIAMAVLINLLVVVFAGFEQARDIFAINVLIIAVILIASATHRHFNSQWLGFLRDWYAIPAIITIYLENRKLIPLVNPHDLDTLIMQIDRWLFFGHDPTILLERVTFPVISEVLQIAYASFYFLPLTLCVLLYRRRSFLDFHINTSTIIMGFYLSYLGYYFTPVIGPRFTMDHLQSFPLSGILTFDLVRHTLAAAEGMMRDCCPSGHALVSLLTILLARRYCRTFYRASCLWAGLIVISTVYLRYHYVADILAGLLLGIAVYLFGPAVARRFILGAQPYPQDSGMGAGTEKQARDR